ncbi:glycine betaine ABC transporter substrate-binding protein [Rhizobium oryzicola]|uniref:Glycine betaine ABC transporter substrate-binding protein n=1 Tax=Rhizobium oryzicola TaxID=1232668 RepID=A0ABT8T167_9HYPH|nr:glycine betaine ABC transporter substrate-binding protein [Rhizobium oryzicola]MDO1584381.1 glycine betaine ABC transporter substrate-binding protein [Rhizobium oryzicola]
MIRASLLAAGGLLASFLAGVPSAYACGNVSIAEMNWNSAGVAAHVDRLILSLGFGCTAELIPGDTVSTFATMNESGQPDIAPELWVNALRSQLEPAFAQGRLVIGAEILADGAIEGWWIPKFLADAHPEIRTVQDALKQPNLFPDPSNPSQGAVRNCPSGWSCQITTENLYRALNAKDKGFSLVGSGSAAELDASLEKAFAEKTGWLGYYWAPTAIFGKHQMVKLSMGVPFDKAEWDGCTSVKDCANPKPNSYPTSQAFTVVTRRFADSAGPALAYLKARQWGNGTLNTLLAWQSEHNASNEQTALYFLKSHEDIWSAWLTPDIADKVKAGL